MLSNRRSHIGTLLAIKLTDNLSEESIRMLIELLGRAWRELSALVATSKHISTSGSLTGTGTEIHDFPPATSDQYSPRESDRYYEIGAKLQKAGNNASALEYYENALKSNPHNFWALISAAGILHQGESLESALGLYRRALEIEPRHAGTIYVNIGVVLKDMVRISEAKEAFIRAIELSPESPEAHYNLGLICYECADLAKAQLHYEAAIAIRPDFHAAHSSLLCLYGLGGGLDPREAYQKHREWAVKFADPLLRACIARTVDRSKLGRLTVGYVSGDFRNHSMQFFIEPVLSNHDRNAFNIICYDNWAGEDIVNRRLHNYVDAWRKIAFLDDESVVRLIQNDRVDILVDLSGHTAGNRLLAFARKPAPIQVTWLGYMCTTGLLAMDYRITDAHIDPPGQTEIYYSERLFRIPAAATYAPAIDCPLVNRLPALQNGYITFASVNNFTKVSDEIIALWVRILDRVPGSHLRLLALGGDEPEIHVSILKRFLDASTDASIDLSSRITIQGRRPIAEFLRILSEVDIALDPFPYSGGTTSLHTLWMGVPIVTMEGDAELSRSTGGMIRGCGLSRLVANSMSSYLKIASELASDFDALAKLRSTLREKLSASTIGSGREVTASLESAYQSMWSTHLDDCSTRPDASAIADQRAIG